MTKYALIIGIQKYGGTGFGDLEKPAADAEAIAQILEKYGDFVEVTRVPSSWNSEKSCYEMTEDSLTSKKLEQKITSFFEKVDKKNEALIYFSGHGYEVTKLGQKKSYLVTSDCTTETVAMCGIALEDLNTLILNANLSSLVVLLDCCHSGSLLEKSSISKALTAFNSGESNYFFATACRSHEKAYEGEEYSVFTDAVLKALRSHGKDGRVRTAQLHQVIEEELRGTGQEPVVLKSGGEITLVTYAVTEKKNHTKRINPSIIYSLAYFQDREDILQKITNFLNSQEKRLLIIHGRSGLGKTTVVGRVLQFLENGDLYNKKSKAHFDYIIDHFDYIIELSALNTNQIDIQNFYNNLCSIIKNDKKKAELKNLYQQNDINIKYKIQKLLDELENISVLIILDNFESVMTIKDSNIQDNDLSNALTYILTTPSNIKIIITTRQIPSELIYEVENRYDILKISDDNGLPTDYAEKLLRELDEDGTTGLKTANKNLLERATNLTRGYPQALVRLHTILKINHNTNLTNILNGLQNIDDISNSSLNNFTDRIIEALVGNAYKSLDPESQKVMQALAIYKKPVSPEAIDYLLLPYVLEINSNPILGRLLNMYLVKAEKSDQEGHQTIFRYYLHSTDRQYALNCLLRGQPEDHKMTDNGTRFTQIALFSRAANYCRIQRHHTLKNIDDLVPQLDEIDLRIHAEDYVAAAHVLFEIDMDFLSRWGKNQTVIKLHEVLQNQSELPVTIKEKSLRHLGVAYTFINNYDKAIHYFENALKIVRNSHSRNVVSEGFCLAYLSYCYHWRGDNCLAIDTAEQSLKLLHGIQDSPEKIQAEIRVNATLGLCYCIIGKTNSAIAYSKRAYEIAHQNKLYQEENRYLGGHLGVFNSYLGNFDEAICNYQQALNIANEIGDFVGESYHLGNLSESLVFVGRYDKAIESGRKAIKIANDICNSVIATWSSWAITLAYLLKNDVDNALAVIEKGREYDELMNSSIIEALYGIVLWRKEKNIDAQMAFTKALKMSEELLQKNDQYIFALDSKGIALAGLALSDPKFSIDLAIESFCKLRLITMDKGHVERSLLLLNLLIPKESLKENDPLSLVRDAATGSQQ